MTERFDCVIFGSGFGGAILSMVLRRQGLSVLLLESGRHPRFVIGESSTPFANLLLEQLSVEYDLPFLKSLSEWGSWQRDFPEIGCGLKRGFTFYHHRAGEKVAFKDRAAQLLVAASPNDVVADTHWYRPDFDHFLVRKAQEIGVKYLDQITVAECEHADGWRLKLAAGGGNYDVSARFAVDASGGGGFLARYLKIPAAPFTCLPPTSAIYAHFRDLPRLHRNSPNTPYPPDDAALHHVFAEGWIWVLRFNNGIISAGAALSTKPVGPPEQVWQDLMRRFPTLDEHLSSAVPITEFREIPQLSFRRSRASGADWVLLPSSAGFVDPLLSTGFALNLLGIRRLGHLFKQRTTALLSDYEKTTFLELDATAELIGAMYARMGSFPDFAALSLLYFAALSFTESAWRLGKQDRARTFLLSDDSAFTALRRTFCERARKGLPIGLSELARAIEPWDVAGLGDLKRGNFYPVVLDDLLRNCGKLGVTESEVRALWVKLGVQAD